MWSGHTAIARYGEACRQAGEQKCADQIPDLLRRTENDTQTRLAAARLAGRLEQADKSIALAPEGVFVTAGENPARQPSEPLAAEVERRISARLTEHGIASLNDYERAVFVNAVAVVVETIEQEQRIRSNASVAVIIAQERIAELEKRAEAAEKERDERDEVIKRFRGALENVRDCVGGDNPAGGMDAPEDVWEIADTVLRDPRCAPIGGTR